MMPGKTVGVYGFVGQDVLIYDLSHRLGELNPRPPWWQKWWQTETEKPDSVGLRGNLAGHSTPTAGTT